MGANHVRCLEELPEAELVAVSDLDAARATEVAKVFGCRAYDRYQAMLAEEQPNAVVVAVPTEQHLAVALDVVAAGSHVLVEKPIADSPANARRIIDAARQAGVRLAVGHIERFNPAVRRLKEVIEAGMLGKILSISARRVGLPSAHHGKTNVVVDLAVHDLDIMRFLLGQRPRVLSSITGHLAGGASEDHADIMLLAGEVPCVLQVNWVTPVKVRTLSVVGSAGYAELNYITQTLQIYRRQPVQNSSSYKELRDRYGDAARDTVYEGGEEPLKAELRSFFQAIALGTRPEVTGEDGLIAVEMADEVLKSATRLGDGGARQSAGATAP